MQQNQKTQPFSPFCRCPKHKETRWKKPRKKQPTFSSFSAYTSEEGHAKDPFTSIQCMKTSYELNPHSPSHKSTENPEAISSKTHSSLASKNMPNTHQNIQLETLNGKLIFNPSILFFFQIFPTLTSICMLERG